MSKDFHGGIIRVEKSRNYSVTNNTGAHDKRLSWGAKGILWYALTRPDNWVLTVGDLVSQATEGEAAVKARLRELKQFGYLKKERLSKGGKFEWITTLYEVPRDADFSHEIVNEPSGENQPMVEPESPSGGLHPMVLHPMENRPIYKGLREQVLNNKVLIEEVVVEHARETKQVAAPPPPPREEILSQNQSRHGPIEEALCHVCGLFSDELTRRDQTELQALLPFLRTQGLGDDEAVASAIQQRFACWDKPTAPHLSQIKPNWRRMTMAHDRTTNPQEQPHAKPTPTAGDRRVLAYLERRASRSEPDGQPDDALALPHLR